MTKYALSSCQMIKNGNITQVKKLDALGDSAKNLSLFSSLN